MRGIQPHAPVTGVSPAAPNVYRILPAFHTPFPVVSEKNLRAGFWNKPVVPAGAGPVMMIWVKMVLPSVVAVPADQILITNLCDRVHT